MNDKKDNPFLTPGNSADADRTVTGWSAEHYQQQSDERLAEKKKEGYEAPPPKPKPMVDPEEIKKIQFEHREKSSVPLMLGGVAVAIAIGLGAYFMDDLRRENQKVAEIEKNTIKYIETNTKQEALLIKKAQQAIAEGNIDYPPRKNAISYLGQVLGENRINGSAARLAQQLFDNNIKKARGFIEARDTKQATLLLNQASALSFYLDYEKSRELIMPMRQAVVELNLTQTL